EVTVAPVALIPREETELLGHTAIDVIKRIAGDTTVHVVDMCCGSGNLACALAHASSRIRVWAADLTEGAVALTMANVAQLGLGDRVTVHRGDLFGALTNLGLEGSMDLVVCNPPYISSGRLTKSRGDLLDYEPIEAFDGGPYGVSIFQRVIRDAQVWLKPGGHLLFEVGEGQDRQVSLLFARAGGYEPAISIPNAAGVVRVMLGRKTRS